LQQGSGKEESAAERIRAALDHPRVQGEGDSWRLIFSDLLAPLARNDEPTFEYEAFSAA
jgi:hypothetical protein